MTDKVDDDHLFCVQYFVYDAVVANTKLVETYQIACQRLRLQVVQVLCQPMDSSHNATTHCSIQLRQFTGGRIQDPNAVQGSAQTKFRYHFLKGLAMFPRNDGLPLK